MLASCLLIFLAACGVRLVVRGDAGAEVRKVQTAVTNNYQHMARVLGDVGVGGFFSRESEAADPDTLGHPPGYPVVLALAGGGRAPADSTVQLLQIAADALAAVLVFLLALELLSPGVAAAAGLLVALAPQFAWNSVLLLPDTLAVQCNSFLSSDARDDTPLPTPPLGWSWGIERGRRTWICQACARENLRSIEGKLDEDWW